MSSARQICYLLVLFAVYIMIFGAVMYAVEKTEYEQKRHEKGAMLQNLWMNIQRKYNMTREEFDDIKRVIHQTRVDGEPWTFQNGIKFAIAVCTTIGYGNITPKTTGGMMLCIIGAIFGIPLTVMTLNAIGAVVKDGATNIIHAFETRVLKHTSMQSIEVKRLVIISVLMTLMVLVGATIITQATDWSFREGVYYWFISFSTIGFGDYVANDSVVKEANETLKPAVAVLNVIFILSGLAILASGVNCVLDVGLTGCLCCSRLRRASQVENNIEMTSQQREKEKNSA